MHLLIDALATGVDLWVARTQITIDLDACVSRFDPSRPKIKTLDFGTPADSQ